MPSPISFSPLTALVLTASLLHITPTQAAVIDANPTNYRSAVDALAPGDTLRLAPGTYADGLSLIDVHGTAAQPIVIAGADDQSSIFTGRSCCNTVQLQNASYIEVRNLTLDGLDIDGVFAVDARGTTHHITLENLRIVNHGAEQQTVGISTKGPAWNWIVRRNTIIGAGTGMYFGNSDGTQPFVAGLIEHNLIVDTLGYNIQIKHQQPRPTGIGLPGGVNRTIIRHNVFSKRNNGSTGELARPNLLVGHLPLSGEGVNDRYEIYGNFFYENPTEVLFQGEGNIALHDNLFVNSSGSAVAIQPHLNTPRDVTVYHNTVVASSSGIRVSGGASGFVQRIIGNAVFAATPISGPNQQNNITGAYAAAATELNAPFAAIGTLDLFPKSGRLAGSALDLSAFAAFSDAALDFNGRARSGTIRGAYEGSGNNDGWRLALAIKPATLSNSPAPAITIGADPLQVSLQGTTVLSWSVTGATSCTASGGWSGSKPLSGSEAVGPLAANTAFTMTCSGTGGSSSKTVNVSVGSGMSPPTVSLTASPASIPANATTQLSWTSAGASSCLAAGGWSGSKAISGSQMVGPLAQTTTFSLECAGAGGTSTAAAQVSVAAPPAISLLSSRQSVQSGESVTLTWNATNATGCQASGDWSGNKAASGSESIGPLAARSTFVLTCDGAGGTHRVEVTVAVQSNSAAGGAAGSTGGQSSGGGGKNRRAYSLALRDRNRAQTAYGPPRTHS